MPFHLRKTIKRMATPPFPTNDVGKDGAPLGFVWHSSEVASRSNAETPKGVGQDFPGNVAEVDGRAFLKLEGR